MNEGNALLLKTIKTWLSSPQLIGYPLIVFALVWPVATGFIGGETPGQQFAFSIHLYDLLGAAITALALLIARVMVTVEMEHKNQARAWPQLVALSAAAVSGVTLPVFIVESFSYVPEAYLQAIPFGIVSQLTNLLFFILVWNSRAELRTAVRNLAVARKSLTFLKANLQNELASNQSALENQVMSLLEPTIVRLTAEMEVSGDNYMVASSLRTAVDQVVRPLSQELAETSSSGVEQTVQTLRQFEKAIIKLPARERWAQAVQMSEAANVSMIILAQIAFVIPATAFLYGVQGSISAVIAAFAIALANHRATKLLSSRVASYLRVLLIATALGLLSAAIYFLIVTSIVQTNTPSLTAVVAVLVFISDFTSGYISCQLAIRRVSLDLAMETNEKLQAVVTGLKQEVWLNRRRMARIVHGSVQANLQSAALRLIRGTKDGPVKPDALIEAVAMSLQEVLSANNPQPKLSSAIMKLQQFWSGACELSVTVDAQLLNEIEANHLLAECVYELIAEATSNAVKHAAADEVDVHITAAGKDIEVEVRNALEGHARGSIPNIPGYGSRIFDEITTAWELAIDNSDVILKATLPLRT